MSIRFRSALFMLVLAIGLLVPLAAQDVEAPPEAEADLAEGTEPSAPERTRGLLFSTNNILLDIGTYGTGFGMVLHTQENAIRASLSGFASNSSSTLTMELGGAWVNYVRSARVSPYWVVSGSTGFLTQNSETDPDNWTRDITLLGTVGAGFGAEFFLLEFLSLFAEYQLVANFTRSQTTDSVGGTATPGEAVWTYFVQTELGNSSRLGIAVYLKPVVEIESEQ